MKVERKTARIKNGYKEESNKQSIKEGKKTAMKTATKIKINIA